ncbi:MAG: hypothetical protein GZ088_16025 [Acidipila sp.]|nr:hypothetical protein [Acidipila sp.]
MPRNHGNYYPNAGTHSQPEIREAVERFRSLPADKRAELPLLWWLLQDSTQAFKASKIDSRYTAHSPGKQSCASCDFIYLSLRWNKYICSQIEGEVAPAGWCRLWERSTADPYTET